MRLVNGPGSDIKYRMKMRIWKRINFMRILKRELGKLVGGSKTGVATWEQGDSLPSADLLYTLSKIFNKSINYMYGEDE